MQRLLANLRDFIRRVNLRRHLRTSVDQATMAYRAPQVPRSEGPRIYLRLLTDAASMKALKLGPILGATVGTIAVAGFTGPALGQTGEEACAFVFQLRSPYTIERVLERFPNDPCIPMLLETLPLHLLRRVDVDIIANLPPSQLRKVSAEVLEDLGIRAAPATTTRSVPRTVPRNGGPYGN